jgi:hypothetical protein
MAAARLMRVGSRRHSSAADRRGVASKGNIMHARNTTLVVSLLALAVTPHAMQRSPTGGASATPGNRIVGLWSTQGTVSGCTTGVPVIQVNNNLLFQAGGTVIEAIAPTTARTGGMGVWSYDPTTGWYTMHLRFDRFAKNAYIGFSTIDRQLLMSEDGQQISGSVRATGYAPDGTVIAELCGEVTSERLY